MIGPLLLILFGFFGVGFCLGGLFAERMMRRRIADAARLKGFWVLDGGTWRHVMREPR